MIAGAHGDDDVMEMSVSPLDPAETGPVEGLRAVMRDQDNDGKYIVYYNLAHGFDE